MRRRRRGWVLLIEREESEEANCKSLPAVICDLNRGYDRFLAEVDDVPLGDKLFVFACGCADVVELAFDRCGNLTSRPGSASANSISERIVDAAVELQADVVSKRAEAVVVFDKFFVVHGIVSPAIMSIN